MRPCWTPQGTAELGVGFLSIPLPENMSIDVCMNRGRPLLLCFVNLMLVRVQGVSPLCLPREAWPDFVCSDSETFPRVHQAALAPSGLSPAFYYLFAIRVSLHVRPGLRNLPWYNPACDARLEWLSVLPPG